jgi:hypothetical protein
MNVCFLLLDKIETLWPDIREGGMTDLGANYDIILSIREPNSVNIVDGN